MAIIQSSPNQHSPVYNCLRWEVFAEEGILINGSTANVNIVISNGGTLSDGTIITIAGVQFKVQNGATANGYLIDWNGLSGTDRATSLYNSLIKSLYFSPDKANVVQFGNAIGIVFSRVGLKTNWAFNDGGASQIVFSPTNGTDPSPRDMQFIHYIVKDRSSLSLADLQLTAEKITPMLMRPDEIEGTVYQENQYIDYSTDLRKFVSTSLPNIYTAALSPYLDPLYSTKVYLRVGLTEKIDCDNIQFAFENSEIVTIYNALFQNIDNIGQNLLEPYIFNGKPFLIKNTYEICTNQSFYVWAHSGTSPSIVYYDANNAPIESASFDIDTEGVNIINCGTDVLDVPSNCAYYVIVFGNDEQFPIRFNIVGCGCKEAEVIFLSDLGAYEVRTFDQLDIIELSTNSDITEGNEGCDAIGLITNGKSVVNTETQKQYTFSTWLDSSEQEIEFAEQFKRSQSIHIKTFVPAADAYIWQKVVPLSINFNREFGKRPRLSFTYIPNLNEVSHEQNNSYSSI